MLKKKKKEKINQFNQIYCRLIKLTESLADRTDPRYLKLEIYVVNLEMDWNWDQKEGLLKGEKLSSQAQ